MADPHSRRGVQFYGDAAILNYLAELHVGSDPALERAFTSPERYGLPGIMVGPNEGRLLSLLVRLAGARKVVEIGTLAGYSTIHLARGLPADGHVYTIEEDPRAATVARNNFTEAGLTGTIELFEGPALKVLPSLEKYGPFDAVFIDADKGNYDQYGRWAADNLRQGGLLLGDNAFYFRRLLEADDVEAQAMRRFHEEAARQFDTVCIPTPDGLLLGIKH